MGELMDENHQDKTGSKPIATVDDLWLPPLSPRDQKKLDRLRKDRKKARQPLIVIGISAAFVGVIALVYIRFRFNWSLRVWVLISLMLIEVVLLFLFIRTGNTTQWTGFRGYDKIMKEYTPDGQLAKITKEHQPGKTFWDWLQLLIIPIILAGATIGFGLWQAHLADLQHQQDQRIALDQQQATILQTYIDNIQDLLLNHNLLKSKSYDDVAILARARTLTALKELDPERKGRLLIFLHDARLIDVYDKHGKTLNPIIYLNGADLSYADLEVADFIIPDLTGADFRAADLSHANLSGAILHGAHLSHANLYNAILSYADLTYAHLSHANLNGADLQFANLSYAILTRANFRDADLSHANLSKTDITQQQLDQVAICSNATLPPGLTCRRTPSP
jgi:uncharacterized protein YjbI with pentapeptide repeats